MHCSAVFLLGLALALAPAAPAQDADDPGSDDAAATAEEPTPADTTDETPAPAADSPSAPADATPQEATPEKPANPRRALTYSDALAAAGEDGVAVFCYGPDWNMVSTRMLKSFWQTPAVEEATGGAILVAVPFYEDPTPEQKDEAHAAAAGMPAPPFGVCPTVMLFDKDGTRYANMPGADFLGTEEDPSVGLKNLREKIAALRKRNELRKKVENLTGIEKAKVLNEIAELPITAPRDQMAQLINDIKEADPTDQSGMVRRNTFSALAFLYEQMNTKDGFLLADFVPDYRKMTVDCMKVIKDTALREKDRQAAYLLLIGQARREEINGPKFKNLVNACAKLDPNSSYGKLAPILNNTWATRRIVRSRDEVSAQIKREREKKKERQHKANVEKKADRNGVIR